MCVLYHVFLVSLLFSAADFFNIGLVFEDDEDIILAFNYQSAFKSFYPLQENTSIDDSFQTLDAVCSLLEQGVVAIFGPLTEENSDVVQSVCDTKEIPHIETRWNDKQRISHTMINIHPHPQTLGRAYVDLVKLLKWNKYTILFEDNEGLSRISPLIQLNNGRDDYTVLARNIDKYSTGDYRPALKEAWKSGHTNFILDCNIENLDTIFMQAQQIGLMTHLHSYIVTNMDFHTINLEPYQHSGTKIIGIRLINPDNEAVKDFARDLQEKRRQFDMDAILDEKIAVESLRLQVALMVDAISLFSLAHNEMKMSAMPMSCDTLDSWQHGLSLIGFMKGNSTEGLTGTVRLDHEGFRTEFALDIIELTENGVEKVGVWDTGTGIDLFPRASSADHSSDSLRNKTFTVIIALTDPYNMLKETHAKLEGNDRFEGFGIDLIHELSILEGFNYTFIVREDKANGAYNATTGKWSGMIGDVMYDVAHFAITDLTITAEREAAVDFTAPFMTLGISILYQKPSKAPPDFFSFAQPFAFEVWLFLGGAYFMVSISLFIMGRLCPSEWTNPYPCIEEPEFLLNQFSLRNSFWFTIGSLMQQGTEIAPIAYATRMQAGIWWFFTLIMVSSYTANLAACLALESLDRPFTNVNELVARAEKAGIKYGAKLNGATANFFKKSDSADFRKIAKYMEEHEDDVMVKENKDGVLRADTEKYAFFMESTSIEYEKERHCNLDQIGDLLDEKGYGIAMKKGSIYRIPLNTAMLKLQASGKIQALKRKWWEERRGGGQCTGDDDDNESVPLNLPSVEGVFWVTVGGISIAIVLVFLEMVIHTLKQSVQQKTSFCEDLKEELKFFIKFRGLVKTVRNRKSNSKSPAASEKSTKETPAAYGFLPDITKSRNS